MKNTVFIRRLRILFVSELKIFTHQFSGGKFSESFTNKENQSASEQRFDTKKGGCGKEVSCSG